MPHSIVRTCAGLVMVTVLAGLALGFQGVMAQVPQISPPWSGDLPENGGLALLVATRDVTPDALDSRLREEGCRTVLIATTEAGEWRVYVVGAPPFVNAEASSTLVQGQPFVVRCADPGTPLVLREADADSTVHVRVGDELRVVLPSNPTTGYAWRVDPSPPTAVLEQIGEPEFTPESDLLGAGGLMTLTFRVTGPGSLTLRLIEDRVFETAPPLRVWSVTLTASGQQPIAWLGEIKNQPAAAPGTRYFELRVPALLEGSVPPGVGLQASDGATANAIEALVDTGTEILLWGEMTCGVADYGGCRVDALTIREADSVSDVLTTPVTGWAGTLGILPGGALDYFQLDGPLPVQYGVSGATAEVEEQLREARELGQHIRIWGALSAPSDDVNRARIVVSEVGLAP